MMSHAALAAFLYKGTVHLNGLLNQYSQREREVHHNSSKDTLAAGGKTRATIWKRVEIFSLTSLTKFESPLY